MSELFRAEIKLRRPREMTYRKKKNTGMISDKEGQSLLILIFIKRENNWRLKLY